MDYMREWSDVYDDYATTPTPTPKLVEFHREWKTFIKRMVKKDYQLSASPTPDELAKAKQMALETMYQINIVSRNNGQSKSGNSE